MSEFETYLLTDLEISFVSACPQGANPGAKVMLKKEKSKMSKDDNKDSQVNVNVDIEALSKSMTEGLSKTIGDLMSKSKELSAEAMTEAVVAVVSGDIAKVGKEINDQLKKAITDVQKDLDDKVAQAKKDAEVSKDAGEETLTMNGSTFKKSAVGDAAFQAIKASYMQQEALRKELEDQKLTARVEKEYPNIAGKPESKAALLGLIEKADDAVKETGLAVLKALNEAGTEFKKETGGADDPNTTGIRKMATDTDASIKLEQLAKEYAQKNNVGHAQAYTAVLQSPEGESLYEQHVQQSA